MCDNGLYCDGVETCDPVNDCQYDPVPIDDGVGCTDDACDPGTGCVFTPNAKSCDDGDPCTVGDTCIQGSCSGIVDQCDDGDPCTDDSCGPIEGAAAVGCASGDASLGARELITDDIIERWILVDA